MAIINRSKDPSERKDVFVMHKNPMATGLTMGVCILPYPCLVQDIYVAANGLSGSPVLSFQVERLTSGGATAIGSLAGNLTLQAVGTSGPQRASMAVTGSSLLNLQASDMIVVSSTGSNTAANDVVVEVVVKKLQDIVSYFGVST